MSCWRIAAAVMLAWGIVTAPLQAAIFTISNSAADAFVVSLAPASNYGAAGAIGVAATGSAKGEFQSLIRFDLAAAKTSFDGIYGAGQWTLDGVQLSLGATNPNNALFNNPSVSGLVLVRWVANDSWAEGTGNPNTPQTNGVTWNTLPSFLSGADQALGSFTSATTGTVNNTLNVTSGLIGDAQAGSLASLLLLPGDSSVAALYNSSTGTVKPMLTLSAVAIPEPGLVGAGFLLGVALFGWNVHRRRNILAATKTTTFEAV